ncbi:Ankyrin and armadillo repeat-containing protein, partial [Exaiptasia diaphana]
GVEALVSLLDSKVEHVLVNTVNALRVLVEANMENQTKVANSDAVSVLIDLLGTYSKKLQANTAACLSALVKHHLDNQNIVIAKGAVQPLVKQLRNTSSLCQVKAASALESLAEDNPEAQGIIDQADAAKPLIRLLKVWSIEVKEQAAGALWALAGSKHHQQQVIASLIGVNVLVDMLMLKSEVLQYISGMAIIALGTENIENQNKIVAGGGVQPLVRLLRSGKTSEKVLLMVIRVLGILCVGPAHQSNKSTQMEIANAEALITLVKLLRNSKVSLVQVETAICIAKIVLNNNQTQKILSEQTKFTVVDIMHLLKDTDQEVRLKAGMALSTFGYNNTGQQYAIKKAGGLLLSSFEEFLSSDENLHQAHAAFQIIILARVIGDCDQVTLTARGVEMLVSLLRSEDDATKVLAASLTASLGHSRAGIPDALITAGAVESLLKSLFSENDRVRISAAVALGYLSFNRTAERMMLVSCRNTPGLFDALISNLGGGKVAMVFIDDWKETKSVGLPSESLEINGGPPVPTKLPHGEGK